MDLIAHLTRQAAFSRATFGPGARTKGVCDHIRKELVEIEEIDPQPNLIVGPDGQNAEQMRAAEWVDVAILGLDGLLRSLWEDNPHANADQIARQAADMIRVKQGKNERRNWPDWRTAPTDKAIEHVKGKED